MYLKQIFLGSTWKALPPKAPLCLRSWKGPYPICLNTSENVWHQVERQLSRVIPGRRLPMVEMKVRSLEVHHLLWCRIGAKGLYADKENRITLILKCFVQPLHRTVVKSIIVWFILKPVQYMQYSAVCRINSSRIANSECKAHFPWTKPVETFAQNTTRRAFAQNCRFAAMSRGFFILRNNLGHLRK